MENFYSSNNEVVEELARTDCRYYQFLSKSDMLDNKEKQIFKTIEDDDVQTLKQILPNPVDCRLGQLKSPILLIAVLKGDCGVIKFLIDNECDIRHVDENGSNVLHLLVWNRMKSRDYYSQSRWSRNDPTCYGCQLKWHRMDILEILLAAYGDDIQAAFADIFLNANIYQTTPFLLACAAGCDSIITRLIALLDHCGDKVQVKQFIGFQGNNAFHFLLDSSTYFITPSRARTAKALLDKIPNSDRLIEMKNHNGATPLHYFLHDNVEDWNEAIDLVKIFFERGASPDAKDENGLTYLEWAIANENVRLIEVLLRAGCRTDLQNGSPLYTILNSGWRKSKLELIRVVESFLSFGFDLRNERYLCPIEDLPIEADNAQHGDLSNVDPDILEALREIRRSNVLISLQWQCRNAILRHLKGTADEVIEKLTCIPDPVKSFLLVENKISLFTVLK